MTTALLFVASLVMIVVASELFTNAVEWAGYRMHLASGATGSLLAAIGTALPEFVVPVVALITAAPNANSVAIGAVLGAPFLLLTLGVAITGVAVMTRREARVLVVIRGQARRDLGVFIVAFSAALLCIVLPAPLRIVVGALLLAGYLGYAVSTLRGSAATDEAPEPLHFVRWRKDEPHALLITVQLVVAILLLVVGSQLFVTALNETASALHVATLLLALIVVPMATELPETLNSVLWVRSRDDMLAFGNVAGSATFQACILGFIGVTFTTWRPGPAGLIGALLTLITAGFLLLVMFDGRARGWLLMLAAVPWVAYVGSQLVTGGNLGT